MDSGTLAAGVLLLIVAAIAIYFIRARGGSAGTIEPIGSAVEEEPAATRGAEMEQSPAAGRPLPPTKEVRVRRPGTAPATPQAPGPPRTAYTLNAPFDRTVAWMSAGPLRLADRTYLIGREPSSDLVLSDQSVSARHATLTPREDGFELTDLGSTNGTTVNGRPVAGSQILRGGETIGIGDVVLRFDRRDEP
ncbi:MAG TPA: FHA domain-containing protein [Candidatus Limnocylindria bacterium]|nr:FHA domain-containing protein [Candidatus Limnocylindria bacterium]